MAIYLGYPAIFLSGNVGTNSVGPNCSTLLAIRRWGDLQRSRTESPGAQLEQTLQETSLHIPPFTGSSENHRLKKVPIFFLGGGYVIVPMEEKMSFDSCHL